MTRTRQLLRRCQARRTRANHRHFFTCFLSSGLRHNPSITPAFFGNKALNGFDTYRVAIHIQSASRFARRWANTSREFRKIIGGMQGVQRLLIVTCVHQIIPIRNDIVDGAARCTKRRAAIHTARCLYGGLFIRHWNHKFFVMLEALGNFAVLVFLTLKLHKTCHFTHTQNLYAQM